jgi:hypothetical protein
MDPPPTMSFTGTDVTSIEQIGANRFDLSATIDIQTSTAIPVSFLGLDCTMNIDTSPGTYSAMRVHVPMNLIVDAAEASGYRIAMGDIVIDQFETADVTIGGGFACQAVEWGVGFFVGLLEDSIASNLHDAARLCIVPAPELVAVCPPPNP